MKDSELIESIRDDFRKSCVWTRKDFYHRAYKLLDDYRSELISKEVAEEQKADWPKQMPVDVIKAAISHLSKEDSEMLLTHMITIHDLEAHLHDHQMRCRLVQESIEKLKSD